MSCDPNFLFSIDNHDMTIIEVDGVNSLPHTVDKIQIFAAQRYSFVVRTRDHHFFSFDSPLCPCCSCTLTNASETTGSEQGQVVQTPVLQEV